jgi:hypothetical protein
MSMRRVAPAAAVLLVLGLSGLQSARADIIRFNPNGTGAPGALNIGSFDESVGNAVAVGAAPQVVGNEFQLYYQAVIGSFIDNHGNVVAPPAGTQFTIVAGFREVITSISGPAATPTFTFGFAPGAKNYLEIYANTNPATFADNSAGTGFNTGHLILSGSIFAPNPTLGNFSVTSSTPVLLDQFDAVPPPKFATQLTLPGVGSTNISATVNSFDPLYFVQPPQILSLNFVTTNGDPFSQQSPSQLFVQNPGGPGVLYNPTLGAVNGFSGPDVQFQADASNSFTVAPEPTGVTLLSIGLVSSLLGGFTLRRKRKLSA